MPTAVNQNSILQGGLSPGVMYTFTSHANSTTPPQSPQPFAIPAGLGTLYSTTNTLQTLPSMVQVNIPYQFVAYNKPWMSLDAEAGYNLDSILNVKVDSQAETEEKCEMSKRVTPLWP